MSDLKTLINTINSQIVESEFENLDEAAQSISANAYYNRRDRDYEIECENLDLDEDEQISLYDDDDQFNTFIDFFTDFIESNTNLKSDDLPISFFEMFFMKY